MAGNRGTLCWSSWGRVYFGEQMPPDPYVCLLYTSITHHMDEAAKAQRVVVLDKGKVAADGTPKEVFSQVELLHGIGLAAPETVELCWKLNQEGFDLPLDKLDPKECAQALYDMVMA